MAQGLAAAGARVVVTTREGWTRHVPLRRYEEIAGAAVYLASDEAAFTTGQVLAVHGGFAAAGMIFDIAAERS